MGAKDRLLVILGKVPALSHQLAQAGISADDFGADPREVEPYLQVAELRVREQFRHVVGGAWPGLFSLAGEVQVARILADTAELARLGHPAGDEGALLGRQLRRRPAGKVQVDVAILAIDVVRHLRHQRGHQVERLLDRRIVIEQRRHLVVVLGAAQPHPGQKEGVLQVILVVRLVHVPDEGHMQGSRHGKRV